MAKTKKELKISAINYGTVIDHIPSDSVFKVASILGLDRHDGIVSIATNLPSRRIEKKGIIKVGDKILTKEQVDKIAIIAPEATLNLIKNYNVVEKTKVVLHDYVEGIIKCSNPKCVTNNEPAKTKFYILKKIPLKVKCHYCERVMNSEDIEIK